MPTSTTHQICQHNSIEITPHGSIAHRKKSSEQAHCKWKNGIALGSSDIGRRNNCTPCTFNSGHLLSFQLKEYDFLQENENLQFLRTLCKLYAGDGFVYAEGAELLGKTDAAPGILAILGKEKGSFRCPGEEKPFAMYLPLAEGTAPSYFGLAFD